jgi:hypothetical protein
VPEAEAVSVTVPFVQLSVDGVPMLTVGGVVLCVTVVVAVAVHPFAGLVTVTE